MSAGGYDLEEIRRRADIVEIISPHVALRKAGRRLTGLCPFHKERTPSFTVDPESGLWHCFGCKAGGDLFRFLEMIEKVTFSEAVEMLGRRYGIAPMRRAEAAGAARRDRMLALHADAAKYFQKCLRAAAAQAARDYLSGRGLSGETIASWGLGYAPPTWDALLKAMARRGYSGEELARAGLAVAREAGVSGEGFYDRFRDRIIFPISDASGRVIAFGGRAMTDEQQPKYLNSPETPVFQKGRLLYAFDRARRAMADAGRAVVVEGYLDAIACHEAGFPETVATMGTALTSDHVELLRRRVPRLVLSFDSDSAGLAAALRGRELFQSAFGGEVLVVTLPPDLDPDRVVREQGPEAFQALVAQAVPITEWELRRILSKGGADSQSAAVSAPPDDLRPEVLKEAVEALARLPAGVEREYYVRWLAQQVGGSLPAGRAEGLPGGAGALENALRAELARADARRRGSAQRTSQGLPEAEGSPPARPGEREGETVVVGRLEKSLLAAFLQQPDLAERYLAELEAEDLSTAEQRSVLATVAQLLQQGGPVTVQAVLERVEPEARELLAELAVTEVPQERLEEQVRQAIRRLVEGRLRREESALRLQIEAAGSAQEREALLGRLSQCRRRRSELAGEREL